MTIISESEAIITSIVKDPIESEIKLAEDGYYAHEYAVLPFGDKHFFPILIIHYLWPKLQLVDV